MLNEAQRRRLASARMDPPIGERVAGALMVVLTSVALAWSITGAAIPWREAVIVTFGVTASSWVAVTCLIRGEWEPLVALLGRLLEQQEARGQAPRTGGRLGTLDVLTWFERRDLVAALLRPAEGRRIDWVRIGWLALGLAGFSIAVALWRLHKGPPSATLDFLVCVFLIALGSFVSERARWRPIVAALRGALGIAELASITGRGENAAHPEGTPDAIAGLSEAEQRAVTRASREAPPRVLLLSLCVLGAGLLLLYRTGRDVGAPAWRPELFLTGLLAIVAVFESGYLLGRGRWRRIVAIMRDEERS